MVKSVGWELLWQELDNRVKLDFVDPQAFKSDQEELTAHRKLSMMKKIVLEIKGWVDMQIEEAQALTKIERGEGEAVKRI